MEAVHLEQICIPHKTPRDLITLLTIRNLSFDQVQDIVSAMSKAWNNMSHRLHQITVRRDHRVSLLET